MLTIVTRYPRRWFTIHLFLKILKKICETFVWLFLHLRKYFKEVSFCMALIAATRAEGGLVFLIIFYFNSFPYSSIYYFILFYSFLFYLYIYFLFFCFRFFTLFILSHLIQIILFNSISFYIIHQSSSFCWWIMASTKTRNGIIDMGLYYLYLIILFHPIFIH